MHVFPVWHGANETGSYVYELTIWIVVLSLVILLPYEARNNYTKHAE